MTQHPFATSLRWLAVPLAIGCWNTYSTAETPVTLEGLVVVLIDQADVPAAKSGVLAEFVVGEGDKVAAGQLLARLDDREAALEQSKAKTQLAIAEEKLSHQHAIMLAETQLSKQQQLLRQHEILMEIAKIKAENDVRVLAAQKSEAVAQNELRRAVEAREKFTDSVSRSEVDNLRLAHERAGLESQQAKLDRQLDAFQYRSEEAASKALGLEIERWRIEGESARADARILELEVELGRQQHQLRELAVELHRVVAPWDGMVTKRFRHSGEWVQLGDPVLRLIRVDRLRAEGYATAAIVPMLQANKSVELTIDRGDGQSIHRSGRIVYISPELDPVNQERPYWVEFDNPDLDVLPGMRLSVTLSP